MCRQNHGFGVDYFALGVMAYEFMLGRVFNFFICQVNQSSVKSDHILGDQEKKSETLF